MFDDRDDLAIRVRRHLRACRVYLFLSARAYYDLWHVFLAPYPRQGRSEWPWGELGPKSKKLNEMWRYPEPGEVYPPTED